MSSKIKILFVGINPDGTELLDLQKEAEMLQAKLYPAKFRERFELEQRWKTEATELPGLLMRYEPQILHFSGHGTDDGQLYFQGADGYAVPAEVSNIARLFGLLEGVRCVVLNACHSAEPARLIARYVDVVIGMGSAITDDDATRFTAGFYEGLGYGKGVSTAFELGRFQIGLSSSTAEDVCVMHVREGVDASTLLLLEPESAIDAIEVQVDGGPVSNPTSEPPPKPEGNASTPSMPSPSESLHGGSSSTTNLDSASQLGGNYEPAELELFLDQLFSDDPTDWNAALEPLSTRLWPSQLSSATTNAIVVRARTHARTTLTWLAWFEPLAAHLHPAAFARLCRATTLLHDASDPALVLSRLCRLVNPPHAAVGGFLRADLDRGSVVQLVLRDLLPPVPEDVPLRASLAAADFRDTYLVGLDARGVTLPSHAEAWTGADLRHADLEAHIDTRMALCEVGRVHALDLPVARGGGIKAVRLPSGLLISAHEDTSLRVWSADGPLVRTLWPGVRSSQLTAWGEAVASLGRQALVCMSPTGAHHEVEHGGRGLWYGAMVGLPDGRLALTAGDGWIEFVAPISLDVVDRFRTGRARVSSLCVVGEGAAAALIWGAYDGSIGVHPLAGGSETFMRGEEGECIITLAALGPDRFAAATKNGLVRVWSTTGEEIERFDSDAEIPEIAQIPDGFALGDTGARIRLWRAAGLENLAEVHRCSWGVLAIDARRLLVVAEHRLQEWTLAGELRREVRDMPSIFRAAISDTALVWSEGESPFWGGEVRVWHLLAEPDEEPPLSSTAQLGNPNVLRLDGTRVLSSSGMGHVVRAWDGGYAEPRRFDALSFGQGTPTDLVPVSGGLALGTKEHGVVWQRKRPRFDDMHRSRGAPSPKRPEIRILAVSPSGEQVAAAYVDAKLELLRGDQRVELEPGLEARALCWIDEDTLVLAHDGGLVRVHRDGGAPSPILDAPARICQLAAGPDGVLLAGCEDGTVTRWASLAAPPCSFHAHTHALLAVHERPDQTLLSVAADGVRIWSLDGGLREQLNTIGESVLLRVRPNSEWPLVFESLRDPWSMGVRGEITDPELNRWLGAFVCDARADLHPDAPPIRVPISALPPQAWRWGTADSARSGSHVIELRWPEDPGARRALAEGLLGPAHEQIRVESASI